MPRASALTGNRVTLGSFRAAGAFCAIDVAQLREVVRWQEPVSLPHAPRLIEGVIELRGAVVPVVDLGRVLGQRPVNSGSAARYAIVELDGLVVGLAVDRAEGVLSVAVEALEDPPALVTQAGYDAVRAVVRRPGAAPLLLLSLEHVLECVYRSSSDSGEEAA